MVERQIGLVYMNFYPIIYLSYFIASIITNKGNIKKNFWVIELFPYHTKRKPIFFTLQIERSDQNIKQAA